MPIQSIRVLLADDHDLVRQGVLTLLRQATDIEVVAEAKNGLEALKQARSLRPDLVIMDVSMRPMNGLTATKCICQEAPGVKVLMLTIHDHSNFKRRALEAGACGYIAKNANVSELLSAIRKVHCGEMYFPNNGDHEPHEDVDYTPLLTPREQQTLKLLAQGKTILESAEIMGVARQTLESYRTSIKKKLALNSIAELTHYAIRAGLVDLR